MSKRTMAVIFGLLWCGTTATTFAVDAGTAMAWLAVSTVVAGVVVMEGRR